MPPVECSHCQRKIPEGSTRYALELAIYADYDGAIDPRDEDLLLQAVREAAQRGTRDMEEQILMERRYVLCPQCRKQFLELLSEYEPLEESPQGEVPDESEGDGTYH